jgi:hypothetical protein
MSTVIREFALEMTNDVFDPGKSPARHLLIDGMETYAKKDRDGGNLGYIDP